MEAAAMAELKGTLGECMAADEIEKLWLEYERGETNEAKLVKDFDKVSKGSEKRFCSTAIAFFIFIQSSYGHQSSDINSFFSLSMQIEMILQATEYESAQGSDNLQEFFDSTAGKWRTEIGQSWAEEIYKRRNERRNGALVEG